MCNVHNVHIVHMCTMQFKMIAIQCYSMKCSAIYAIQWNCNLVTGTFLNTVTYILKQIRLILDAQYSLLTVLRCFRNVSFKILYGSLVLHSISLGSGGGVTICPSLTKITFLNEQWDVFNRAESTIILLVSHPTWTKWKSL